MLQICNEVHWNMATKTNIGTWNIGTCLVPWLFYVAPCDTHPRYQDNVDHDYDFALLRLDKPVPINECIGVACLPTSTDDVGEECSITGWGTLVASGPTPDVLQQAKAAWSKLNFFRWPCTFLLSTAWPWVHTFAAEVQILSNFLMAVDLLPFSLQMFFLVRSRG